MATVLNSSPTLAGSGEAPVQHISSVTRIQDCAFSGAVLLVPGRRVCVCVGLCPFGMADAGSHKGRVEQRCAGGLLHQHQK